jgi:hypothetical protein
MLIYYLYYTYYPRPRGHKSIQHLVMCCRLQVLDLARSWLEAGLDTEYLVNSSIVVVWDM